MNEKTFAGIPVLYLFGGIALGIMGLLSLKTGWLDSFFWAAENAHVKGIDFFCGPKAFLNLKEGRSMFDTWGGTPYYQGTSTWYLSHPAFAVWVTSWYSWFEPITAWWAWNITQMFLLWLIGILLSVVAETPRQKGIVFLLSSFSMPAYWMMYVGNWHSPVLLSLALLFTGLLFMEKNKMTGGKLLFTLGLWASLFSKPVVVLMLPLFLLLKETRKTTLFAGVVYGVVSLLMLVVPLFNPQSIGLEKTFWLMTHPDFIKANLNIYQNQFKLNEYMLDNSIHWTNLIAQSEYYLNHIEIFSLSVYLNTLAGKELSPSLFKLPILIGLALSVLTPFISSTHRIRYALLLCVAFSLTFFLSYNTVWEYQYASIMPVACILFILSRSSKSFWLAAACWILLPVYGPSLYFLLDKTDILSAASLSYVRLLRTLPVLLSFLFILIHLFTLLSEEKKHWDALVQSNTNSVK